MDKCLAHHSNSSWEDGTEQVRGLLLNTNTEQQHSWKSEKPIIPWWLPWGKHSHPLYNHQALLYSHLFGNQSLTLQCTKSHTKHRTKEKYSSNIIHTLPDNISDDFAEAVQKQKVNNSQDHDCASKSHAPSDQITSQPPRSKGKNSCLPPLQQLASDFHSSFIEPSWAFVQLQCCSFQALPVKSYNFSFLSYSSLTHTFSKSQSSLSFTVFHTL